MTADSERIIGLYERHAHDFNRERQRSLFEKPWLDRFLNLLSPGGSILDLGCGSAEPIARYFIEKGYDVTGVDSSATLIAICKDRFADLNWLVADMRELNIPQHFDGILAWDSFFHLCPEDQRKMFPIFRRHAANGAALMLPAVHRLAKRLERIMASRFTTGV